MQKPILALFLFALVISEFACLSAAAGAASAGDTIKIATWNIQNFGQKKANDAAVMAEIARTIKDYDIIAVQEISSLYEKSDLGCYRNEDSCPPIESNLTRHENCGLIGNALENYLNDNYGLGYEFAFSDYVKDERYLFIYDPSKIELISSGLVDDPDDSLPVCDSSQNNTGKMLRQPFMGEFRAGNFTFTLLTAHTSPSKNVAELEGLAYFFGRAESSGAQNIIVLGDLNADCSYLSASDNIALRGADYTWAIPDTADTTAGKTDCAYDRFIFKPDVERHFTKNWGLVTDTSTTTSDHYLVWAEFSLEEIGDSSDEPGNGNGGTGGQGVLAQVWALIKPAFELIGSLLGGMF